MYIYICMYVCMYIRINDVILVHVHTYVYIYTFTYIYIHLLDVYTYISTMYKERNGTGEGA